MPTFKRHIWWMLLLLMCWTAQPAAAQYAGAVHAAYDAKLGFTVTGRITAIHVKPGDRIEAGQIIATLDDTVQKTLVELAQKEAASDVAVRTAQQRLERARAAGGNAVETAQAQLELEQAQLQHALAQQRLQHAQAILDQHTLKAPVAGLIESVDAIVGEVVTPGRPVVRLIQTDKLLIDVAVPTQRTVTLTVGQSARVTPRRANAQQLPGRIVHIANTIDPQTDTRRVRIAIDNPGDLLAGTHVEVELPEPTASPPPSASREAQTAAAPQRDD